MVHDITYFAVGAGITGIVVSVLAPRFRYRLSLMGLAGLWATIPLFVRELGIEHRWLLWIHQEPYIELFWFHHTVSTLHLDLGIGLQPADELGALAMVWLLGVIILVEYRAHRKSSAVIVPTSDPPMRSDGRS